MDILQIAGFSIVGCCLILTIRQQRPEFAMLLCVAVGALLLLTCVPRIQDLLRQMQQIATVSGIQQESVFVLFKVIGIVYVTEFAAGVCKDAQEEGMALKVQIAGKLVMLSFALPLMGKILKTIGDMLL